MCPNGKTSMQQSMVTSDANECFDFFSGGFLKVVASFSPLFARFVPIVIEQELWESSESEVPDVDDEISKAATVKTKTKS